MAWNPEPEVAVAREFGERFRWPEVIIIGVDEIKGTYKVVSYGRTRLLCSRARALSRHAERGLVDGLSTDAQEGEK